MPVGKKVSCQPKWCIITSFRLPARKMAMISVTLLAGTILVLALVVLTSFSGNNADLPRTLDQYLRSRRIPPLSVRGFREVCRIVLNTNSLKFVAANAPPDVVSSYGNQQQRLARLSLQVASAVLVQRLAHDGSFVGSSRTLQSPLTKL